MAAPKTHTEEPDHDTNAEIRQLCKANNITRRRFYDITNLSSELSPQQFYNMLRGELITPGTVRAIDLALITFRDWLHSESGKKELAGPQRLLSLIHADCLALDNKIKRLAERLNIKLTRRPTYDD